MTHPGRPPTGRCWSGARLPAQAIACRKAMLLHMLNSDEPCWLHHGLTVPTDAHSASSLSPSWVRAAGLALQHGSGCAILGPEAWLACTARLASQIIVSYELRLSVMAKSWRPIAPGGFEAVYMLHRTLTLPASYEPHWARAAALAPLRGRGCAASGLEFWLAYTARPVAHR
jgi:hypothetical protein